MSWFIWLLIGFILGYISKDIMPFPDEVNNNDINQRIRNKKGLFRNFLKRKR